MRRWVLASVVALQFFLLVAGCTSSSPTVSETTPEKSAATAVIDYVQVLNSPLVYNDKTISVAGRISAFKGNGTYVFYFNDRLSGMDGKGFLVYLDKSAYGADPGGSLSIGDYVIVEGTWKNSSSDYSDNRLADATIIERGGTAEELVAASLEQWAKSKRERANKTPIVNYMDIVEDRNSYKDQCVRVVGEIFLLSRDPYANYVFFQLKDLESGLSAISVYLDGCPQEMQDSCEESEYVVVSGAVSASRYDISLHDCYIECIGKEAETAYREVMPTPAAKPTSTPTPTPTPTPEPTREQPAQTWVLNTNTMKIHYPSCSSVSSIAAHNYAETTATIDELLSRGYSQCGRCF